MTKTINFATAVTVTAVAKLIGMKFYNRDLELKELKRIQSLSFEKHSRMTVITGRRRIGKTSLAMKVAEGEIPSVYLFVSRKSEAELCTEFSKLISVALGCFVPEGIISFRVLFKMMMELAKSIKFNLIIDEFQEFENINPSVYSDVQNIWDQYRKETNMNLILMGSVFSMMHKIFEGYKEPLFGRADNIIRLRGFGTSVLKEIMRDYRPDYTNDELLALYAVTGGVPKYVEMLCENTNLNIEGMFDYIIRDGSPFTDEGKNILIEEFGRDYGIYFSILGCLASGINTQARIEDALGHISVGGQLRRLMEDYSLIGRKRPIMAKERSQLVRYEISDNFLFFWFRYFHKNYSMVEIRSFNLLREIIDRDYNTFSGGVLEKYFRQKMIEKQEYSAVGAWWERKKGSEANEVDLIALDGLHKKAVVAEVKRHRRNYDHKHFMTKVERLKDTILNGYEIENRFLSLEDM